MLQRKLFNHRFGRYGRRGSYYLNNRRRDDNDNDKHRNRYHHSHRKSRKSGYRSDGDRNKNKDKIDSKESSSCNNSTVLSNADKFKNTFLPLPDSQDDNTESLKGNKKSINYEI